MLGRQWPRWQGMPKRAQGRHAAREHGAGRRHGVLTRICVFSSPSLTQPPARTRPAPRHPRRASSTTRHRAVSPLHLVESGAARAVRRPEDLSAERRARESRPHEHAAQPRGPLSRCSIGASSNWHSSIPASRKFSMRESKPLLRQLGRNRLPAELLSLPKRGFSAPIGRWIASTHAHEFRHDVLSPGSAVSGLLDIDVVRRMFHEHALGREGSRLRAVDDLDARTMESLACAAGAAVCAGAHGGLTHDPAVTLESKRLSRRTASPVNTSATGSSNRSVRCCMRARSARFATRSPGSAPERVLEIAPGPGRLTVDVMPAVERQGARAVLVEASAQMLAEARLRLGDPKCCRLVQGDAFNLPLGAVFDLVYVFRLIRHFRAAERGAISPADCQGPETGRRADLRRGQRNGVGAAARDAPRTANARTTTR